MKKLVVFSIFLSIVAHSKVPVEFELKDHSNTHIKYVSKEFKTPKCAKDHNCKLYLGEVADSFKVYMNDKIVRNSSQSFIKFESQGIDLPSNLFSLSNKIELHTFNIDGLNNRISNYDNAFIANESVVKFETGIDWFRRTGVTLASIYTLIVICILLSAILWVIHDQNITYILLYCIIAIIYLVSFSEVPRFFYNPKLLSGAVHFPLRLIQDFMLFLLFHKLIEGSAFKLNKTILLVSFLYIIAITAMVIPALFGLIEVQYHLNVIKIAAPLVAMPMGYAFYLSLQLDKSFEKKIFLPASSILFIFQLNDLFLFWGLIDTFYTVKFYIPFVVLLLIFIYLCRVIQDNKHKELLAAKNHIVTQVLHDIKSPIAAINVACENLVHDNTEALILRKSVDRLNSITQTLLPGYNKKSEFNISESILSVIDEKIYPVEQNLHSSLTLNLNKVDFERMISNLLDNANEASELAKITISTIETNKTILIEIKDDGEGIPSKVLKNLGSIGNTSGKQKGSGLGLYFMTAFMKSNHGRYKIKTNEKGTEIQLIFKKTRD